MYFPFLSSTLSSLKIRLFQGVFGEKLAKRNPAQMVVNADLLFDVLKYFLSKSKLTK